MCVKKKAMNGGAANIGCGQRSPHDFVKNEERRAKRPDFAGLGAVVAGSVSCSEKARYEIFIFLITELLYPTADRFLPGCQAKQAFPG